jgi:hypothetical protein
MKGDQMGTRAATAAFLAVLSGSLAAPAKAQDMYIYPARGQTQDQQNRDRYECNNWAVQQSGYDPTRPNAYATAPPPQPTSSAMGGGMRGATVGAIGGAIGGNAGKGAAIGAASGALLGGMARNREATETQAYQQQQSAAYSQQRTSYDRAMGACLEGRGYTIK